MNSSYDSEVDAYYFSAPGESVSIQQVFLGQRDVIVDIDINGKIVGVEIL